MRLGSVLFAVLLAASLVAAAITVRAKTPDLMVEITHLPGPLKDPATGVKANHAFTPDGDGRRDIARFRLLVRGDEPHATVEIVGPFREPVRVLADDVPLTEDDLYRYAWNGRTDDGTPAPPGRYRVQVLLPSLDRDVVDLRRIELIRG